MKDRVVTVYEHQTIGVGEGADALSRGDAVRLAQLGRLRPGFCTLGHRSVRLAQFAGLVNLDGRILEILPKVGATEADDASRGIFLRLLRHALGLRMFAQGGVGHDLRRHSLLDVFVTAFLEELSTLTRRGLLRRYRTEESRLPVVRGRLLVDRQAAVHAMRPDMLECRFDDLTVDNPWNQVLKAALHSVRPWITTVEAGRRWLELAAALDDVSLRPDAVTLLDGLVTDRSVQHYQAAIRWAQWILRLLSPNIRAGQNEAPELLFDMNRLFESAVAAVLCKRAFASGLRVAPQEATRHLAWVQHVDQPRAFVLRPDLVMREAGNVVAVGDTKWTRVGADAAGWFAPAEAHIYQMHAYASLYPCEDFALVYPWHAGLTDLRPTSFRLPEIGGRKPTVHVVCVDVADDRFPVRSSLPDSGFARLLGTGLRTSSLTSM